MNDTIEVHCDRVQEAIDQRWREENSFDLSLAFSLSLLSTYLKNENNDEQLELSLANLSYFNVNPFVE